MEEIVSEWGKRKGHSCFMHDVGINRYLHIIPSVRFFFLRMGLEGIVREWGRRKGCSCFTHDVGINSLSQQPRCQIRFPGFEARVISDWLPGVSVTQV